MALAISPGSPKRRMGVCPIHSASRPAERSSSRAVRMRPGATRFTVIPYSPTSLASENEKAEQPRFGRRIVRVVLRSGVERLRGNVHDASPAARFHHRDHRPGAAKRGGEVQRERRLPDFIRHGFDRHIRHLSGVVDQDVDGAELRGGFGDDAPGSVGLAEVAPKGNRPAATAADLFHHLGGLRLAGGVMHAGRRAVGRQRQAGRAPDASGSSGDNGRVARQVQVDKMRIGVHGCCFTTIFWMLLASGISRCPSSDANPSRKADPR